MRHDDIETTMAYYVETRSEEIANDIRRMISHEMFSSRKS
jgi:hypothetical protein